MILTSNFTKQVDLAWNVNFLNPILGKDTFLPLNMNLFFSRGPALFNIIPPEINSSKTLNSFKNNLQKFLNKIPDTPPLPNYLGQNNNSLLEWVTGSSDLRTVWLTDDAQDSPILKGRKDVAIGGLVL